MADNNEIKAINKTGFAQRLREYKRKPLSLVLFILVVLAAAISVLALVFLIVYILGCSAYYTGAVCMGI